jgi:hypothetical protein
LLPQILKWGKFSNYNKYFYAGKIFFVRNWERFKTMIAFYTKGFTIGESEE